MASVNAFKVRAIIEAGYDKTSLNRANRDIAQSYNQLTGQIPESIGVCLYSNHTMKYFRDNFDEYLHTKSTKTYSRESYLRKN